MTPVRWNLSEDAAYDAQFPAHPLTLVRVLLSEISAGARLAPCPFGFVLVSDTARR